MSSMIESKALRRTVWVVASAVAAVLMLWLLAWLLVPPILKSQAQKIGSEQLGRAVTIGSVDFKPWSLELTLADVSVAGATPASPPLLRVSRAYANAEFQSVFRLAPVVDAVTIDGVQVDVAHLGDGKYDFDDVLARLAQNKAPAEPSKGPARFALYNLTLGNAAVNYNDVPRKRVHQLRDLNLSVPFLSSFDGQRDVTVEPRLAFVLNGSRFDSAASSTPFAQTRKTDATLNLSGFDLEPYLQYIPASVPVKVQGAVIDAELKIGFQQAPATSVTISGNVKASKLKVADVQGRDLFALDEAKVTLIDVRPLEKVARLGAIELASPSLVARRDADGRINLALGSGASASDAASRPGPAAPASGAPLPASSSASSASSPSQASPPPAGAWKVEVASVALRNGKVTWNDEATGSSPAVVGLGDLSVDVTDIALPFDKAMKIKASAGLTSGPGPNSAGKLEADGTATDKVALVNVKLGDTSLDLAAPYLAAYLEPTLGGKLAADVDVSWKAGGPLSLKARDLTLDDVALVSALPEDQRTSRRSGAATANAATSAATSATTSAATLATTPGARPMAPAVPRRVGKGPAVVAAASPAAAASAASPARASDPPGKTTVARIGQLKIVDADIDLSSSKASIGSVTITEPRTGVSRAADKHWMFERWRKKAGADPAVVSASSAPASTAADKPKAAAWSVSLNEFAIDGGAVTFVDNAGYKPVSVVMTELKVRSSKLTMGGAVPSPLAVSAKVGSGRLEAGSIDYKGTLGLEPVAAQGTVELVRIPVHAMQPYFGDALNVELVRADAGFKGTLRFTTSAAGPTVRLTGDARVDNFQANTNPQSASASESTGTPAAGAAPDANDTAVDARPTGSVASTLSRLAPANEGEELLSWKSLALSGVDVAMAPSTTTTVDVKETALTDVYARLILKENARLNLQDLVKSPAGAASAPAAKTTTTMAKGTPSTAAVPPSRPASGSAAASTTTASSTPVIRFGPVNLVNAKVLFSDHFVKPNYSANLSELTGTLSAFTSVASAGEPQLADLDLKGRAEGTASLDITGKLNPLANPLALDIRAKVRDLELPPLTPYSVKYSGYGIERGKMSVDVHYQVLPNGQLTAENKLVLNQLSFGDKVAGSTASLPVKLAVALLADRNGVIDVDLPLSGSLNDPQFSLGAIIGKAIFNLVIKAITAPFSLLANAFGGSGGPDQSSAVEFKPGSVVISPEARNTLDKVAKALIERPALKMTVIGTSSVDAEREPYRRERLNQLLQAEKRKAGGSRSAAPGAAAPASAASAGQGAPPVDIPPAEYSDLIRAVYKSADIAKPRNMIGLARDIEPAQMEALLLANISVSDESIRELAVERGVAVRDYLASRQLPLDRLFLGAVKAVQGIPAPTPASTDPNTSSANAAAMAASAAASTPSTAPGAWRPSAELTLSPK